MKADSDRELLRRPSISAVVFLRHQIMSTYRTRQTARKSIPGGVYPVSRFNPGTYREQLERAKPEKLSEAEIKSREAAQERRVKDLEKALAKFDEEEKRKKIAKAEAYKKMAEDFEKNYQP